MADNVPITAGSGTSIGTDEVTTLNGGTVAAVQIQRTKVGYGVDGSHQDVTPAAGLPVVQNDLAATGSITTQNLVPAGTATAGSAVLSGSLAGFGTLAIQVTGTYTGALSLQATVDGTTWITLGGTPLININTGVNSATIASATVGIFQADIAGFKQARVTGLAAMTGTAVVSLQASAGSGVVALDAPLPAGSNQIGAVNLTQVNTTNIAVNNGVVSNSTMRVTLASDGTGQLALAAALSGSQRGLTAIQYLSAASTNATNVKASAGNLYNLQAFNNGAAPRYLKIYDKATAPTVGTDTPKHTYMIPPGGGVVVQNPVGMTYSAGIGFAITAVMTVADTTVVVANEVIVNFEYA